MSWVQGIIVHLLAYQPARRALEPALGPYRCSRMTPAVAIQTRGWFSILRIPGPINATTSTPTTARIQIQPLLSFLITAGVGTLVSAVGRVPLGGRGPSR